MSDDLVVRNIGQLWRRGYSLWRRGKYGFAQSLCMENPCVYWRCLVFIDFLRGGFLSSFLSSGVFSPHAIFLEAWSDESIQIIPSYSSSKIPWTWRWLHIHVKFLFRREVFPPEVDVFRSSFVYRLSLPFLLQPWRRYASSISS